MPISMLDLLKVLESLLQVFPLPLPRVLFILRCDGTHDHFIIAVIGIGAPRTSHVSV